MDTPEGLRRPIGSGRETEYKITRLEVIDGDGRTSPRWVLSAYRISRVPFLIFFTRREEELSLLGCYDEEQKARDAMMQDVRYRTPSVVTSAAYFNDDGSPMFGGY